MKIGLLYIKCSINTIRNIVIISKQKMKKIKEKVELNIIS